MGDKSKKGESSMKLCKSCNKTYSEGFEFCPKCGNALVDDLYQVCPKCEIEIERTFQFCPFCGYHFSTNLSDVNDAEKDKSADGNYAVGEKKDDKYANFSLGNTYYYGKNVPQDYIKAAECYKKAAEQGYVPAQFYLGTMYFNGRGVPKDYAKAVEWFTKAAEQGDEKSQLNLSSIYIQGKGVPQDYAKAAYWCIRLAEQGNVEAQFNMGLIYSKGDGSIQDYAKAVEWYTKAAEQGYAKAQINLGLMYLNGKGVPQDDMKAAGLWTKAAEQGNASAHFNLGTIYEKGDENIRDYAKAMEWYQKAANLGHSEAKNALNRLRAEYEKNNSVSQDDSIIHDLSEFPFPVDSRVYGHGSKRISWAPRSATEKEMAAFSKICDVAKHGVKYEENWKALGYSYPDKGFLSFFTKSEDTPAMKKSKLLKEFLLDTIVYAGLDVIGVSPSAVCQYLLNNNKQLSDKDLHEGLRYRSFHYGEKNLDGSYFSLEDCLNENGLPAHDAKRLESILLMIRASYTDIFMQIFKDY